MSERKQDTVTNGRSTVTAGGRHTSRAPGSTSARIWLNYGKLVDRIRDREAPGIDNYSPSATVMGNEIREIFNSNGVRTTLPLKKAPLPRSMNLGDDTRAIIIEIHAIPDYHTSHELSELRQYAEDYRTLDVEVRQQRHTPSATANMDTDGSLNIMITNILPGDIDGINNDDLIQECKIALVKCGQFTHATVIRRPMAKNLRVLMTCDNAETKKNALELAWTLIYMDGCHIVDPATYVEEHKIRAEAGRVLQIGGYGQLMAAHLTEFMAQTGGISTVVPPKHIDGRRGTVAYITYKDRDTMMAAKGTPVFFNGRTNAQYFADKEKRPRPAMERHRPNPNPKTADDKWIPVMACYRCHSDKHVHKECPEKDAQFQAYQQQIDAILRGSRLPREKMPALKKFILSAEAREEPVIPQNELAYEKLRDAGITGLKWKLTQRQTKPQQIQHAALGGHKPKVIPGHTPVSYANATQGPTTTTTNSNNHTINNTNNSNSEVITKLLERTNQLEQDVKNLTRIISQQQTLMAEQTTQIKVFMDMIQREKDGVGRPKQWLPTALRATIKPSEAETILAQRCINIKTNFLLDYTASARVIMRQIVGRSGIHRLDEWLGKIEKISEMTDTVAFEAYTILEDTYSYKYGIGQWQKMSDADKDFTYLEEIDARAKRQQ